MKCEKEFNNDCNCELCERWICEEPDYKKAYHILMELWDSFSKEQKGILEEELKECGL